jgi:hypothetical protein
VYNPYAERERARARARARESESESERDAIARAHMHTHVCLSICLSVCLCLFVLQFCNGRPRLMYQGLSSAPSMNVGEGDPPPTPLSIVGCGVVWGRGMSIVEGVAVTCSEECSEEGIYQA